METPSSTRRVTRSQTFASVTNNNIPMSNFEKGLSRSTRKGNQQQDRSVLFDITNDSPIVGLATGSLETPSSKVAKNQSSFAKMTPGSGEALLRGQVKTLLQKVEEEAELSKLCLESRSFVHNLKGFVNSPAGLLAPTPANTPQVLNLSGDQSLNGIDGLASSEAPSPAIEETLISEVIDVKEQEESLELQKSIITRSLLLDFSEKSDSCDDDSSSDCPSVLTHQEDTEIESKEKPTADDDNASNWSVQVNASSTHGDDDEEEEFEVEDEEEEEEEEEDYNNYELVDELCEYISKISMNENDKMAPKFEGKHTRFVYDSDDEIVKNEEEEEEKDGSASPSILRLNGLPTPKGKHIRFSDD